MEQKRLYRSVTNRKICGVCGGLGEYFNIRSYIDPAWRCFAGLRKLVGLPWLPEFCCSSYHFRIQIKIRELCRIKKRHEGEEVGSNVSGFFYNNQV